MKETTPKSRLEGKRGYIIHTKPWANIVERYRAVEEYAPMLHLVEKIAASPSNAELFGATSMFDLLMSNCEDFRIGDSTLCISYEPRKRELVFRHSSFSSRDDEKSCSETDALKTLQLFLRVKFGVLLETPSA